MKYRLFGSALIVIILLSGILIFSLKKDPQREVQTSDIKRNEVNRSSAEKKAKTPLVLSKEQVKNALADSDRFVQTAVESLREKFGESISDVRIQLKLLRLREFIKKHYPDKWEKLFAEIVKKAFPEQAQGILTLIGRMDEYNSWLATSENFRSMGFEDIKKALDEIRIGFFGKDASLIWSEDEKVEHVRDTLAILDKSSSTIDEKIDIFKDNLYNEFKGDSKTFGDRKYNLSIAFFSLSSVQNDLGTMSSIDRSKKLAEIRKKIGYSDKEIALLSKRDKEREERWKNGLSYMEERSKLETQYEGSALEDALNNLRSRFFGYEAKTIAVEEKSGFFRYNRKRIFGRN